MKRYLGIDIGGTAVKYGIVDELGNVLVKDEREVAFDNYKTPIIETVVLAVRDLLQKNEYELSGIGVSATGQIDSKKGMVAGTGGNIAGWNGTPIKEILEAEFHLPCTVANDANCMCLGECWTGSAKGYSDVIGITIGTGIGGGIVTGGKLLDGFTGLGGEIGHMRIHALDGEMCHCGQRGCYEYYAATTALVRQAKKIDPDWINGKVIFDAVNQGDARAVKLLQDWIDEIAVGLSSMIHIFNPKLILVGGGVSSQEELLIRPLEKRVKEMIMPAFAKDLEVKAATLKNDAGMIGAVYNFIKSEG